jgi:DNA-binding response OmpR family regulator
MQPHHFLLVSKHEALAQVLGDALGSQTNLSVADSSEGAVRFLKQDRCEAVLLDGRNEAFCSNIRTEWKGPIVLLVSRDSRNTILPGYDDGADLHISLPCDTRELVARVQSVVRRSAPCS